MKSDELPRPLLAHRGGTSVGLAGLLAVAAVGGALYLASNRAVTVPAMRKDDPLAQVAALARKEKETEWLQRATRERQAILGMNTREVEMAKGAPLLKQRGANVSEQYRAKGGVENWVYELSPGNMADVLFGSNGLVIHSTDVAGKPREGHAIRQ